MISACELSPSCTLPVPRLQHPGLVEKKIFPAVTASPGHADTTTSHAGPLQRGRHFTFHHGTIKYFKLDLGFKLYQFFTDTSSPAARIQTPNPAPRHCLSAGMPWWRSWALTSEQTAPVLAPRETSGSCSSVSSISDSSGPIPAQVRSTAPSLGLEKFYNNWRNIL